MEIYIQPKIENFKYITPTIYLDSCAIIELSRYEKGRCSDAHKKEIGLLYDTLTSLIQNDSIFCPCGNQLIEVGSTANRAPARDFLFRFTNSELLLPDCIYTKQLKIGYKAFKNQDLKIILNSKDAYKKVFFKQSPFKVHVAPIFTCEKANILSSEKKHVADILNKMKSDGEIKKNYGDQLKAELESEYVSFFSKALYSKKDSQKAFNDWLEEMEFFYKITETSPIVDNNGSTHEQLLYSLFLISPYHHYLPYVWIRANLWTHLMQRPNKIKHSDNLDIQWASAYLPYIDYAITDNDFCEILKKSGLAENYKVKVYSLSTLDKLLEELSKVMPSINNCT